MSFKELMASPYYTSMMAPIPSPLLPAILPRPATPRNIEAETDPPAGHIRDLPALRITELLSSFAGQMIPGFPTVQPRPIAAAHRPCYPPLHWAQRCSQPQGSRCKPQERKHTTALPCFHQHPGHPNNTHRCLWIRQPSPGTRSTTNRQHQPGQVLVQRSPHPPTRSEPC